LLDAVLTGLAQLALSRCRLVGLAVAAALLAFSPAGFVMGIWGAFVATAWPYVRQRDIRLLATGWYGANGLLIGLWLAWLIPHSPLLAATVTLAALGSALLVDLTAYRLGDAPLRMRPLAIPCMAIAMLAGPAVPLLHDGYERGIKPVAVEVAPTAENATASGWAAYKAGNRATAAGWLRLAIERDPDDRWAADGLGWIAYDECRYGEASGWFERAAPLADARVGLGWTRLMQRRPGDAAGLFDAALNDGPGRALAQEGLAWAYLATRRPAEAEHLFLDLLRRDYPGAIQGVADARRALVRQGSARTGDAAEWPALARLFGWKIVLLPLLLLAVLRDNPRAGGVAAAAIAVGVAGGLAVAGPASLLWIDLHLQTMAMIALLVGPAGRFGVGTAAALLAGVAAWAIVGSPGLWLPLLPFNLVGLVVLALRRNRPAGAPITC
jgi:tetratricopeptide (TPR) repeat protein